MVAVEYVDSGTAEPFMDILQKYRTVVLMLLENNRKRMIYTK